jgi:hypothetical protein
MEIGNIFKTNKEIKERKAELKRREKKRLNPKEVKKRLINFLKI